MYTYIPSLLGLCPNPSPIPPFSVIREHLAELPVLYSSFPLAVYVAHGSIYESIPIPQFVHPPLPPLCPMSIMYICVSIPALKMVVSVPFF